MKKFTPYTVLVLPDPAQPDFDVDGVYFIAQPNNKMTIYIRKEDNSDWVSLGETDVSAFVPYVNASNDLDLNNKDLVNIRKLGINLATPTTINYGDFYFENDTLKQKHNSTNTYGEYRKVTGLSPDLSWSNLFFLPDYQSSSLYNTGLRNSGSNKAALVVFPYLYLSKLSTLFGSGYHSDMETGTLISGDHTNDGAQSRSHIYFDVNGDLYVGASGAYANQMWNKSWTEKHISPAKVNLLNSITALKYTPIVSIVDGTAYVLVKTAFYTRIGDWIDLSMSIEISDLTLNTPNVFTLELPVISSFTTEDSVPGWNFGGSNPNASFTVYKQTVDKVHIQSNPTSTMTYTAHINLKYRL